MTKGEWIAVIASWGLLILGGLMSFLVIFASGMKTVPYLAWSDVMLAFPLPVAAAVIAGRVLASARRRKATESALIWTVLPMCIALLNLVFMLLAYFTQSDV